jgi:hypothetical protein
MRTLCRAATRSSAPIHPKFYPWARPKAQTARSIPSKQNRESGLRPIQACVVSPCETWFLTGWSSFPARLTKDSLGITTGLPAERYRSALGHRTLKLRRVHSYMRPDRKRLHCKTFNQFGGVCGQSDRQARSSPKPKTPWRGCVIYIASWANMSNHASNFRAGLSTSESVPVQSAEKAIFAAAEGPIA